VSCSLKIVVKENVNNVGEGKKLVLLKIILSEENALRKQGRDDDALHAWNDTWHQFNKIPTFHKIKSYVN
jgi:hypothetical protein